MAKNGFDFTRDNCLIVGHARIPAITVELCDEDDNGLDLTGFVFEAQIFSLRDDAVVATFDTVVTGSEVALNLASDALDRIDPVGRRFTWSLNGTDSLGSTVRYVGGLVWITKEATRA